MRYSITINQKAIVDNQLDLTVEEVIILDYLYWLCKSDNKKLKRIERDGYIYTWFAYGYFLKQNPIITGRTTATLTPKIKKLETKGFIKTVLSGDYVQKKYICVLPKTELMYGDEEFRSQNKKELENEKCEWCGSRDFDIQSHHYPLSRKEGGKKTVRICEFCHSFYHSTDSQLKQEERKKLTVQHSKQYVVNPNESLLRKLNSTLLRKPNSTPFRKLNIDNSTIEDNSTKDKKPLSFKELFESKIKTDNIKEKEKFISYWTEKNLKGTKEKWQMEKTFSIVRRWKRWLDNIQEWGIKPNKEVKKDIRVPFYKGKRVYKARVVKDGIAHEYYWCYNNQFEKRRIKEEMIDEWRSGKE